VYAQVTTLRRLLESEYRHSDTEARLPGSIRLDLSRRSRVLSGPCRPMASVPAPGRDAELGIQTMAH